MYAIQQPTKSNSLKVSVDYASEAGKLGRHNLSFKTGAMTDRKKAGRKNACRNKGRRNGEW
ncbi:MAG TPA: hypothetical protein VMW10_08730 [Alphaproteobacteria bacterium]|nr:hypothetical protein [Alphaproteobacteria bacterium]